MSYTESENKNGTLQVFFPNYPVYSYN